MRLLSRDLFGCLFDVGHATPRGVLTGKLGAAAMLAKFDGVFLRLAL
jgi:hypothetical protein